MVLWINIAQRLIHLATHEIVQGDLAPGWLMGSVLHAS